METEAEVRVMPPQPKERWWLPEAGRDQEVSAPGDLGGSVALLAP